VREILEGKKIGFEHRKALMEIECQHNIWNQAVQVRSSEKESLHQALQREIESTEDLMQKLEYYRLWLESLQLSLITSEDVNLNKRGDSE